MKPNQPIPLLRRQVRLSPLAWGLLALAILLPALLAGGWFGARWSGRLLAGQAEAELAVQIETQYALGLEELENGDFDRAAQRFQWILVQEPGHEGAIEHLAQALVQIHVGQEGIPDPLEPTPSETEVYDPAEAAGLLADAETAVAAGNWGPAIDALVAARQADPAHETARIDRLLFLALRQRGVQLILSESDLEGGLYHLSLTERFAPLDSEAETVRGWARLYLIGASFWDIFPDRAAFYFGQLVLAAPYLTDRSGIPALERYFQALVQYGDQLFEAGEWCAASEQYTLALGQRVLADLESRAAEALQNCEDPDGAGDPETTATSTATPTATPTVDLTGSPGPSPSASESPSPAPETETVTPEPTTEATPTPTGEATIEPTAAPTEEPTPTPGG
jgi:hypothetical protein